MNKGKRTTDVLYVQEDPFGSPYVIALAVIAGPDCHAIYRIVQAETTVGASPDADFELADGQISGQHFRVRINGNLFSIVDLGSTNGSMLNHNQLSKGTRVRLKNFDEIQVGRTRLLFIANRFRTET